MPLLIPLALGVALLAAAPRADAPREVLDPPPADAIAFTPRHPLWSDGMEKRRWIRIPGAVDKSDVDRWDFPAGTRAWKEFRRDGKPVETRTIERLADGSWRFLTYAWNDEGTQATLAPAEGVPGRGIPSRDDCLACHEGAPSPILGFSAVQLESSLDPALGYLHGNCGHCHNDRALPALKLSLAQRAADPGRSAAATRDAIFARESRYRVDGTAPPRHELLLARMKSRDPFMRMPPLGVTIVDARAVADLQRWIADETLSRNSP